MTRYILGGGYEARTGDPKEFCKTLANGYDNPLILDCFFAEAPETWPEKFSRKAEGFFRKNMPVKFRCELAQPAEFASQVKRADIIYLHGGDEPRLAEALKPFDLPALWDGKTVVGTSSGAMFLSEWAWDCDQRRVHKGSGILKVGTVVHYRSNYGADTPEGPIDWDKADKEIAQACKDIPIYPLKEGQFVVLKV